MRTEWQHPQGDAVQTKIDIKKETERSEWKDDPKVVFEQQASLAIARWIMILFRGNLRARLYRHLPTAGLEGCNLREGT
jgi:hypothetical protein